MRYIPSRTRPCVEATTCPTVARCTAVVICVHTGDAVSRILVVWWKREAICGACRLNKSASLLTTCIVFRVAAGDPIFPLRKAFLRTQLNRGQRPKISVTVDAAKVPFGEHPGRRHPTLHHVRIAPSRDVVGATFDAALRAFDDVGGWQGESSCAEGWLKLDLRSTEVFIYTIL